MPKIMPVVQKKNWNLASSHDGSIIPSRNRRNRTIDANKDHFKAQKFFVPPPKLTQYNQINMMAGVQECERDQKNVNYDLVDIFT